MSDALTEKTAVLLIARIDALIQRLDASRPAVAEQRKSRQLPADPEQWRAIMDARRDVILAELALEAIDA